jgi:hypothetical protein
MPQRANITRSNITTITTTLQKEKPAAGTKFPISKARAAMAGIF